MTDLGVKYPSFMKGYVYPPSKVPYGGTEEPPFGLELEYIYGSSRKGVKGSVLHVNKWSQVLYPSAACGVVFDPKSHSQKIFRKHNDDVKCLALHPDQETVATGECGKKDFVHVWNSQSLDVLASLPTYKWFRSGGVLAMCFSHDGNLLACVGGHPLNSILLVFDWRNEKLMAKRKCATKRTFSLAFSQVDKNRIIWCGKNEIKFFTFHHANIAEDKAIISSKGGSLQSFYSAVFDEKGRAIVGTKNGELYIFEGNQLLRIINRAHNGPIYCLYGDGKGGFLSAGRDGKVKLWESSGSVPKCVHSIDIGYAVGSVAPYPKNPNLLFVWGKYNGLFSCHNVQTNEHHVEQACHSGQSSSTELWGICAVPGGGRSSRFLTCGDDGKIILYDIKQRAAIAVTQHKQHDWRSIASNGEDFTVASRRGVVCTFKLSDLESSAPPGREIDPFKLFRCGREEICVLRYSPNQRYLAVGSHDNVIYIFDSTRNYSKVLKFEGHTSAVTALDWSDDGKYIQSTSRDYELLYWDVENKKRMPSPSQMRDVEWNTQTCLLGWSVRGIWDSKSGKNRLNDGTDLNAVATHFEKNLVVSVDDFGDVNIFRYPTVTNTPRRIGYIGHCSHVTNVVFSDDGEYVLTAGGADLTIFQWRIVKSNYISDSEVKIQKLKATAPRKVQFSDEFDEEEEFERVNQQKKVHPLYRTTYLDYGSKDPTKATKLDVYYGISGKFTKNFVGGMFRNFSINTSKTRGRTLRDPSFGTNSAYDFDS